MSRPAARFIPQRTVPCPTCEAERGRPCTRVTDAEVAQALLENIWTRPPHPARRKAEQEARVAAVRALGILR